MRPTLRSILPVLLLGLTSCGGSDGLKGSICSVYDCGFDTLTIRDVTGQTGTITTVQIDYTQGPVDQAVTRAAVVVCDVSSFVKGQPMPVTSARHIAPDGIDFPTLKEGTCTFDTDLVDGAAVSGSFHAVFTTEAGTDRALYGDFKGTLEATAI